MLDTDTAKTPSRKRKRGAYGRYIAKYAINNGVMKASRKFTADMGAKVNESTVRSIRDAYLKVKKQGMYTTAMANVNFRNVHFLYFY